MEGLRDARHETEELRGQIATQPELPPASAAVFTTKR
jgi:hypothetical protein